MSAINAKIESRRIFPSGGRRNALSAALICIAAGTVLSSIRALITTAVNPRPKECSTKPVPISVIFSGSGRNQHLPSQRLQKQRKNWKHYSGNVDCHKTL